MYSVTVRDHIMIAHSLPDPFFGPAQSKHGATYVIDTQYFSTTLNPQNVVIDIGYAHMILKEVKALLDYKDLDTIPDFKGVLTTTEFLAAYIHGELKKRLSGKFTGSLKVTLGESHVAWASFQDKV